MYTMLHSGQQQNNHYRRTNQGSNTK